MRKQGRECLIVFLAILCFSGLIQSIAFCENEYNFVWSAEPTLPESNLWFGYQFDISGEYIIVNEPKGAVGGNTTAGRVYLYDLDGNLVQTIQSPDPGNDFQFGRYLDAQDNLLVLAEASAHINGTKWVGNVYVYKTDGTLQYKLQPQELYLRANFGKCVEFGENTLLIAETATEMNPQVQGRVNMYSQSGEYIKTILSPDPMVQGNFGRTMEAGEGLILISQYGDPKPKLMMGPGYVYVYDSDGNYLMTLESPEKEERACFGNSLAISGDKIVIGEYYATVNGLSEAGKVHIFNTKGEYLRTLLSPVPDTNAWFGKDVAISGETIVVGEELGNIMPFGEEGRAYVFNVDGTLLQNLTAFNPTNRGAFGLDVDIQDDVIVVGECWADVEGNSDCGKIHVYQLGEYKQAVFEMSNLIIEPVSVDIGKSVTISVDVDNVGTESGIYTVKLMINGNMVEEKSVTIDEDLSEKVTFMYHTDTAGSYNVKIGDLEGGFNVVKPIIPGFPVLAILTALIIYYHIRKWMD